MCFSETDKIKKYTDNYVTLSGAFREIVYLDRNEKVIHSLDEINIDDIGTIWLNSHPGRQNNDKFSILLIGDAIKKHINKNGLLTHSTIGNYMVTCNEVLLESMQGTEKPYVRISSEDEFENLIFIEIV